MGTGPLRSMLTRSPVSATNWYTWSVDGSPIQVRIPLLLIHELRRRLDRSVDSEDSYASEAGLLIGRAPRPGISQITGFHPVARLDPHTVLEAVTRNKGNFIGFYRTTAAGSLLLTADDLLLAEAYFHHESSVVLLVESGPVGPEEAAFFVWRKGRIDGPPLRPFSFDEYQLTGLARPGITELPDPTPVEPPITVVEPPMWEAAPKSFEKAAEPEKQAHAAPAAVIGPKRDRVGLLGRIPVPKTFRRVAWVVPAILLAGAGLFYGINRHPKGASATDRQTVAPARAVATSAALGLTAERSGKGLLLSWDAHAPAILSATAGTLDIKAGGDHQEIALTAGQVRSGSFLYMPATDRLTIRLQVLGADTSLREDSMTIFLPRQSDLHPVVSPREKDPSPTASVNAAKSGISEPPRRFINPPQIVPAKGAPARLDEPPAVPFPVPRGAPTDSFTGQPGITAPVAPLSKASSAPAAVSEEKGPSSPPKPAVAIYQSIPQFPPELRTVLHKATSVEVTVTIDRLGRVVKAQASPEKGAHVLLRQAAMEAARNWRFQPAIVNGQAVASQAVLKFDFKPHE